MQDPELIAALVIYLTMCMIAICVWGWLFAHRRRIGTLLPREPRRPVPWGPMGFLLACFLAISAVSGAIDAWIIDSHALTDQEMPSNDDFLWEMWAYSGIVLFGMALVHAFYRWSGIADRRDLGWPAGWKAWLLDTRIGVIAALAVIGPIYAIQIVVVLGFKIPTTHPLVEAFQQEPRLSVALTIGFSALVTAPIFEELLFRQLAQGWLERLNGDWDPTQSISETGEPPSLPFPLSPHSLRSLWPIFISSFLFALVHLGQGGAPIPLFFLALALGYLYQRTHRIVPCIVLHMLFNALAMALLGVQVALQ